MPSREMKTIIDTYFKENDTKLKGIANDLIRKKGGKKYYLADTLDTTLVTDAYKFYHTL